MTHCTCPSWVAGALGAVALMALATGCYAEAGVAPTYVQANAAPVNVNVAPQYSYEGRTVYYVDEHWYARDRGQWVYYRKEPNALYRQRTHAQEAGLVAADYEHAHVAPSQRQVALQQPQSVMQPGTPLH